MKTLTRDVFRGPACQSCELWEHRGWASPGAGWRLSRKRRGETDTGRGGLAVPATSGGSGAGRQGDEALEWVPVLMQGTWDVLWGVVLTDPTAEHLPPKS